MGGMSHAIKRHWDAEDRAAAGVAPTMPEGVKAARATLRSAPWTAKGWSASSPGTVWWFAAQREAGPRVTHGTDMIRALQSDGVVPQCVRAHMFSHRYARGAKPESRKDKLTYHTAVLLEWDHGKFCTVVELATLNGVGGRAGKANWYHDKLEHLPALYHNMPRRMIAPWKGQYAEIRCHDVESRDLDEFKNYIAQYTGPQLRFLDPHFSLSGPVRLSFRSQARWLSICSGDVNTKHFYNSVVYGCGTQAATPQLHLYRRRSFSY